MSDDRGPISWDHFVGTYLSQRLASSDVSSDEATAIATDVTFRAADYAASGASARAALRAPFLEDVTNFEPATAAPTLRADVAVVVRNSTLENAHSRSAVDDETVTEVTVTATEPLSVWMSEHAEPSEKAPPAGTFAPVMEFPRAYLALQALAHAIGTNEHQTFLMPIGPIPPLPAAGASELSARGHQKRSGLSDLDARLVSLLDAVAAGESDLLFAPSLSRFSRDSVLLAHVLEFLLGHGGIALTTNFMISPGAVSARRPPFLRANSDRPMARMSPKRLSGTHAGLVRQLLAQHPSEPGPRRSRRKKR